MEFQIQIIGLLLMALGLVHVIFPKYFNWKEELKTLSLINKEMMIIHTFFIALMVFLMGLLCVSSAEELTKTILGKRISLGLGIFWAFRLLIQFFGYSSALWKGKKLETTIHIVFTGFWTYLSLVFLIVYIN